MSRNSKTFSTLSNSVEEVSDELNILELADDYYIQ